MLVYLSIVYIYICIQKEKTCPFRLGMHIANPKTEEEETKLLLRQALETIEKLTAEKKAKGKVPEEKKEGTEPGDDDKDDENDPPIEYPDGPKVP